MANQEQSATGTGHCDKCFIQITGPVTYRKSGEDGYEILDGNGDVQIWVRGQELARQVSGLMDWMLALGAMY